MTLCNLTWVVLIAYKVFAWEMTAKMGRSRGHVRSYTALYSCLESKLYIYHKSHDGFIGHQVGIPNSNHLYKINVWDCLVFLQPSHA